ncbi:MAG: hypothetical protein AAFS10_18530, partial [Myxococcota bacterium]
GMQWTEDCGYAANEAMQGSGTKGKGVYTGEDTVTTTKTVQKNWLESLIAYVTGGSSTKQVTTTTTVPKEKETTSRDYDTDSTTHRGETLWSPHMILNDIFEAASQKKFDKAWADYEKLSAKDKEKFDEKIGINKYAQPEVGEAYSIVSNKDEHVDGKTAWNFHWGAVVLKSGGDSVTMENFASSGTDAWDFQMYGPPTKKDQTFHEQQERRVDHNSGKDEYGSKPTTIRVRPD